MIIVDRKAVVRARRTILALFPCWLVLLHSACSSVPVRETGQQVVVLGFDGADPKLLDRWMSEGKLPNIQKLAESGTVQPLGTTEPPESSVAWASFATGTNPGKHGIFDFLSVDRSSYLPDIDLVEIREPEYLFGTIPLGSTKVTNKRKGTPFYKIVADSGIRTSLLRMPLALPPEELANGTLLSGLGVPDIRNTWGTFFYFATDLTQWDLQSAELGGVLVPLERTDNGSMTATIEGPHDPRYDDFRRLSIPLELEVAREATALTIRLQGREETVAEGSWSDWFDFRFAGGPFVERRGISRFYVLETYPEIRLYLEPISLDPRNPAIAISSPPGFASELAGRIGMFKTLGWIHETWGLNEERIDEKVFLDDLFRNMDSLEAAVLDQMDHTKPELLVAVFTATDSVSHMFYRFLDPDHPRYDPSLVPEFGDAVLLVYQRMDAIVGKVHQKLGEDGILIVVSDHGFHPWRREFNTNTWLARNGFLAMEEGVDEAGESRKIEDMFGGGSFFPNVDWDRTQAYSLGLGGIFLNVSDREGSGIVDPGEEYERVRAKIAEKLLQYRDPDTDAPVVKAVYHREEIFEGPELENAPDLQLSFHSGYRTSWQAALGAVPESIVVANLKKWSGDHCTSDRSETSGIFLSNRKTSRTSHSIMDIAPTVMQIFGVTVPPEIDGRAIEFAR